MFKRLSHAIRASALSIALSCVSANVYAAVIIQYHHVDNDTPPSTSITPTMFVQHMEYLDKNGFRVWSLPALLKAVRENKELTGKDVAITFDDGYASVYDNAMPILRMYDFPFTVFVNTGLVGGPGFMNWGELKEVVKRGGTVANHTVSHPHLVRKLEGESEQQHRERIRKQITDAEAIIERKIGHTPGLLAYPYGEYDRDTWWTAKQLGLTAFSQVSGAFDASYDEQTIPRFAFGGPYTEMAGFIEKVNSLPMPLTGRYIRDEHRREVVEPLLPQGSKRPVMSLRLSSSELAAKLQCFATGMGRIEVSVNQDVVTAALSKDLPVGRSKITCTAASEQVGRYYWYSQLFLRRNEDGSWYQEQ